MAGGEDKAAFFESGRQSVRDVEAVLALLGRRLDSYGEILDFGCGCGRILIHLERLAATSTVHGCDIDARAIRWAQANLPWARFTTNQPRPPLDYPDATFDLVYNHSVFTHLDEDDQDAWLAELRRVTKPGGTLLLSVHGEKPLADFEAGSRNAGGDPGPVRADVERRGIAFIQHDSFTGGPLGDAYHSTFHAPWYVLEHWSRFFTVKAYVPCGSLGFQDFVLLERPPADVPIAPPAPSAGQARAEAMSVADAPAPGEPTLPGVRQATSLPLTGPDPDQPGRYGALTQTVRKVVLRTLGTFSTYQSGVDRQIQQALRELDSAVADLRRQMDEVRAAERVHGVLTLNESNVRLWDALRRNGDRLNRLEEDLWAELAKKADRSGEAPER